MRNTQCILLSVNMTLVCLCNIQYGTGYWKPLAFITTSDLFSLHYTWSLDPLVIENINCAALKKKKFLFFIFFTKIL